MKSSDKCLVCNGEPTVQSHLFARALAFRIRSDSKNLVEGSRDRSGVRFSQSGLWDDTILCADHEQALHAGDDYVIRLVKNFSSISAPLESGAGFTVMNPRPDRLVKFIHSTVWRYVVSRFGQRFNLNLGPYLERIQDYVFWDSAEPLQAIVGRSNLRDPSGALLELGIPPYRQKLKDWNVWHFQIGGFDFYLKTDKRPFPDHFQPFLADQKPLICGMIDPMDFASVPMFQSIFTNMVDRKRN